MQKDGHKQQGARRRLVEQLRKKGITDIEVLKAIGKVPRHLFLNSAFEQQAYEDRPFSIGSGQTISQPYTVAVQTQLLEVKKDMKVLEIGTGSGYQASVLHEMGAKVFSIERIKDLYDRTRVLLPRLGYRIRSFYGDGNLGVPAWAPFHRMIITAGAPILPEGLMGQLMPDGIMVVPVSNGEGETMKTIVKKKNGTLVVKEHGFFRFVPLLDDKDQ